MSARGRTIVLSAGRINYRELPVGMSMSNAMVPINGRPVIGWILEDLMRKGIERVTVVVRAEDRQYQDFLDRAFQGRIDLRVAAVDGEGTIVQSLQAGLRASAEEAGPVRVTLGDTLIRDPYDSNDDFVYVGSVEDSSRWCLVVTDGAGIARDYIDKQELVPGTKVALAGYYHLLDAAALEKSVEEAAAASEPELSHVLRRYGTVHPIGTRTATQWYDFGHIDGLVEARRQLLRARAFNTLEVNPTLNTITKVSRDEKLRDEWRWYEGLPEELKVLTPRIIEVLENGAELRMVQEYYGYPSLADLFVYGDITAETWMSILRHLLLIHEELRRHRGSLEMEEIASVYLDKTWKRLAVLREQEPDWIELLERDEVRFNGRTLRGFSAIDGRVRERAEVIVGNAQASIVHGDFCFSNILYDITNKIVRLVDPRGSFGRKGIYGDPRYDIAKLRHSVCGQYDFIVFDMFKLSDDGEGGFVSEVFCQKTFPVVVDYFDRLIVAAGYDLEEIKFIEGLLFLSMLPLHPGDEDRRKMMLLTGLTRLNAAVA